MAARTLGTACKEGNLTKIKRFIFKGANINHRVPSSKHFPLGTATHFGHLDIVKYLLKKGARINARTKNDWTPLYIAAQKGHTEIVKHLLKKGALVNPRAFAVNEYAAVYGATGSTPLHAASKYAIVKALLEAGANPNIKDANGNTPADCAYTRKRYQACCLIMSYGGRLNNAKL